MQYEPIKSTLGRFLSGPVFLRKLFYCLLDLLLLRAWHVKRALRRLRREYPGEASVLDAGSGFGQYTWRMSRMNRKWKIKAVDINREQVEECRKFFQAAGLSGRVVCETADLTRLSGNPRYDLILSVDVMEHIREDDLVFRNFFNSLSDNGYLLMSTPSDKGGSDVHNASDASFIDEHVRNGYGTGEISHKLASAGFRNIEIRYTYGIPGDISWRLSMKYPVRMLNRSGLFFIILPFWYILIFPFAYILNTFDLCLRHKQGTGLLVLAQK